MNGLAANLLYDSPAQWGAGMQNEELYARLSETSLLQGFSAAEIRKIADAGTVWEVEEGTVLLAEGDDSGSLFILLQGEAEVLKGNQQSRPHRLALVGQGAVLGEVGLLLEVPRTGTVRTISSCLVFVLNREAFQSLLDEGDGAGFKLCLPIAKVLAARLKGLTEEVVKLIAYNEALLDVLDFFTEHHDSDDKGQMGNILLKRAEALRDRQDQLKKQLCIEIDEARKARQVAEITKTAYFQQLRKKAKALKNQGASSTDSTRK